jgi:hypothetical protein
VRVVDQHHFHPREVGGRQRGQIGPPAGGGGEVVLAHFGPADFGHGAVRGVAGVGNEHGIAGFQKRHAHVHQPFFRAQQRQHFGGGVQGHAVVALVEFGHGPAQGRRALVALVAVGRGLGGRGGEGRRHAGVGRQIGAANAQVDDLGPGGVEGG